LQPLKNECTLKPLKPFDLAFVGLSSGLHEFTFVLDNTFFACFDEQIFLNSELTGKLVLNKKNNMMDLDFYIQGKVEVECDRCMDPFWYDVVTNQSLYVKFGDHTEEQSADVLIIPATESHIDVSQYFFEFAILGIPVKRVHEMQPGQQCNQEIIAKLKKYMPGDENDENPQPSGKPHPAWDALKNLKFN